METITLNGNTYNKQGEVLTKDGRVLKIKQDSLSIQLTKVLQKCKKSTKSKT